MEAYRMDFRPLNVTLAPRSRALAAYAARAGVSAEALAAGFDPRPDLDMTFRGGRTVADLTFVNLYLGGSAAWDASDRASIDAALSAAFSDDGLERIIAQYYDGPISARMLESHVVEDRLKARFYKDDAERLVKHMFGQKIFGDADPADTVVNMMLPRGVILVDGRSDGSDEDADAHSPVLVDDDAADSTHGLGGYHGSVHVHGQEILYAVGVYSEGENGIPAFDEPWKSVVATFYHELCEARTDPDVEDVIRGGPESKLGWYSQQGGEIGDIPMALAGADLSLVMQEVGLANGGTAPVQLQWSNAVHGPEAPVVAAT
jgi:hypothetical protein